MIAPAPISSVRALSSFFCNDTTCHHVPTRLSRLGGVSSTSSALAASSPAAAALRLAALSTDELGRAGVRLSLIHISEPTRRS
eukprot:3032405-Prymnesium_polylepis.2